VEAGSTSEEGGSLVITLVVAAEGVLLKDDDPGEVVEGNVEVEGNFVPDF